jgi:hypothetical protein
MPTDFSLTLDSTHGSLVLVALGKSHNCEEILPASGYHRWTSGCEGDR